MSGNKGWRTQKISYRDGSRARICNVENGGLDPERGRWGTPPGIFGAFRIRDMKSPLGGLGSAMTRISGCEPKIFPRVVGTLTQCQDMRGGGFGTIPGYKFSVSLPEAFFVDVNEPRIAGLGVTSLCVGQ